MNYKQVSKLSDWVNVQDLCFQTCTKSKNLLQEFCSQVFFIHFSELCCLFKQNKNILWTKSISGPITLKQFAVCFKLVNLCESWAITMSSVPLNTFTRNRDSAFVNLSSLQSSSFIKVAFSFPYSSFFEHLCHTPFVSKVQSVILAISQWLRNWFNSAIVVSNKVTATDRSASLFSIITRKMNVNFSIAGAQFYILGPVIISK